MSLHQHSQLIHMVNQIALNLSSGRDEAQAVEAIRHHLEAFWARSMKQKLITSLEHDDTELAPLARRAVTLLAGTASLTTSSRRSLGTST